MVLMLSYSGQQAHGNNVARLRRFGSAKALNLRAANADIPPHGGTK